MPFPNPHQWTNEEIQQVEQMLIEKKRHREIDAALNAYDSERQRYENLARLFFLFALVMFAIFFWHYKMGFWYSLGATIISFFVGVSAFGMVGGSIAHFWHKYNGTGR